MNIIPARVAVTSASQIEVGEYYEVKGTDYAGLPIPAQVINVLTPPLVQDMHSLGVPSMKVDLLMQIGRDRHIFRDHTFDLWTVNVKAGKGITTGHGYHDRELVKITSLKQLEKILGPNNYNKMIAEASEASEVVDAYGSSYAKFR